MDTKRLVQCHNGFITSIIINNPHVNPLNIIIIETGISTCICTRFVTLRKTVLWYKWLSFNITTSYFKFDEFYIFQTKQFIDNDVPPPPPYDDEIVPVVAEINSIEEETKPETEDTNPRRKTLNLWWKTLNLRGGN